jgi:hypothetical protein
VLLLTVAFFAGFRQCRGRAQACNSPACQLHTAAAARILLSCKAPLQGLPFFSYTCSLPDWLAGLPNLLLHTASCMHWWLCLSCRP